MKKKVILSIIMGIMALSLISCGKSGKISNRKFEKILDAYQLYFEEEYEEEYDDECGAKIIIHTDGMPMMLAFGYEDDKDGEAALFTYQDGEVKCLFSSTKAITRSCCPLICSTAAS